MGHHFEPLDQYFVKVADADVGKCLKMFTLLPIEEIEEIVAAHHRAPEKRMAQHKLASEVTEMVHSSTRLLEPFIPTFLTLH